MYVKIIASQRWDVFFKHGVVVVSLHLALQWAEMRTIRWMCDVKVMDRFTCNELKESMCV